MKSFALLVHACDRYEFLFKGFEIFFHLNWDQRINSKNYFATETLSYDIPGFSHVTSGKGEWSDRLRTLLEDKIEEPYVLYVQEDMWFTKTIDHNFINTVADYAISNDLNCVKLHSSEVYKTLETDISISGLSLCTIDNENSRYLMSHQISLWKKSFLLEQLKPNEHPWRNERKASKRMKKSRPLLHQIDYFSENGKPEINRNESSLLRSEYFTVSHNGMLGENITRFIGYLTISRKESEYNLALRQHFENMLTHDGNPQPRKKDLIKMIKDHFARAFQKTIALFS